MSLWKPYAEAPLDLTKVKKERHTPEAGYTTLTSRDYYNPGYYQPDVSPSILEIARPVPYYPYAYQPYAIPSVHMLPVSTGSTYARYEIRRPAEYRTPTLSPPLPSKPTNYIAEAEQMLSDDPDFQVFESDALRAMVEKNGGTMLGNNPRMRRAVQTTQAVDDSNRMQRERKNIAAKQSRDKRKLREIRFALKVAYLKNKVSKLKGQLALKTCAGCRRFCDS